MQQYALSYIIVEGEMFPAIYSDVFEKLFTRMIAYVVFFFPNDRVGLKNRKLARIRLVISTWVLIQIWRS